MTEENKFDRRQFMGAAAVTIAATLAEPGHGQTVSGSTSFGPVKQIDAGLLNVGYVEAGPANGRSVVLLHGWPYDIYSYVDVAPLLAAKGYRVIIPYLRGYGGTRFPSDPTPRHGPAAG